MGKRAPAVAMTIRVIRVSKSGALARFTGKSRNEIVNGTAQLARPRSAARLNWSM
jgi:hypothetical protein